MLQSRRARKPHGITSIGPGGIEIVYVGSAAVLYDRLQSDLVELKLEQKRQVKKKHHYFNRTWWN